MGFTSFLLTRSKVKTLHFIKNSSSAHLSSLTLLVFSLLSSEQLFCNHSASKKMKNGSGLVSLQKRMQAKKCGGEAAVVGNGSVSVESRQQRRCFDKPSWLLCNIADMDEKMRIVIGRVPKEQPGSDSFSARANSYYNERPHLLALLHELYNGYLTLADRYCQVVAKHGHHGKSRCSSPVLSLKFDDGDGGESVESDAESSLSFQAPTVYPAEAKLMDVDVITAQLVMKMVECEIALSELSVVEKRCGESFRKVELQRNLLGLLESERLILLNDNGTLEYRVSALVEENKGLASESEFLKKKATELAKCVLKTREDHRVYALNKKIEDLDVHFQMHHSRAIRLCKCFSFGVRDHQNLERESKRSSKLWAKVKKFTSLLRGGHHFSSANSCENNQFENSST